MRVTTKGQVTIPLKIRQKLKIKPASEVNFIISQDGRVYIEKAKSDSTRERFSKLRGVATIKMTTEEIMALTRSET